MHKIPLLLSIFRGAWLIEERNAVAMIPYIDSLIKGESTMPDVTLSEKNPLICTTISVNAIAQHYDGWEEVPENSIAIIPVHGVMLKYGTWCSYGTIKLADFMREAIDSDKITGIIMDFDSGGGEVAAVAPLLDVISYAKKKGKPVCASVDVCCSAAYYVACHCDKIIASNDISAEIGSIGVMMQFQDLSEAYKKAGIKIHTIYSDYSTEKNKAFELAKQGKYDKIKEEMLNPTALKFQSDVKKCRSGKLNESVSGILSGKTFYAQDALKYGLIDAVGDSQTAYSTVCELIEKQETEKIINNYFD